MQWLRILEAVYIALYPFVMYQCSTTKEWVLYTIFLLGIISHRVQVKSKNENSLKQWGT